jgi:hypothetical protein
MNEYDPLDLEPRRASRNTGDRLPSLDEIADQVDAQAGERAATREHLEQRLAAATEDMAARAKGQLPTGPSDDEIIPALLHLQQQARPPQEVCESGALALLPNPVLQGRAGFLVPLVPEGLEQTVAKDLRLAFFITFQAARVVYEAPQGLYGLTD